MQLSHFHSRRAQRLVIGYGKQWLAGLLDRSDPVMPSHLPASRT
ncbi:hypothetical protein I553_8110 [Mycobacterium xenopi 4042]|uniref:Uncharacterized protein n=1 Tax=Mycobacterium xenopi 4042 TaxID=1299334 RepID=X8DAS8_MYCXE|nr:hypothetical protein I553_8110 [Mycobacterium xenopi 4042]